MEKPKPKPMTMAEAVEYLGICRKTIYNLIWRKKIPCYKPNGRLVYFSREDLEKFMFRNRQAADYELNERAEALLNERGVAHGSAVIRGGAAEAASE
jgi:excisionase family DNA binding protein